MKKKKLSSSRKERIQPERQTLFPQKVYHFNLVLGEIVEEPLYKPPITFIPRRDCESSTEGGTIVFTYVLFLGRKRILDFQNPNIPSAFLRP